MLGRGHHFHDLRFFHGALRQSVELRRRNDISAAHSVGNQKQYQRTS